MNKNYNIFKILGVHRRETRHSKFLADLLNPNGCHGQGSIYLEAFIDKLKELEQQKCGSIEYNYGDNVRIETEYNIGDVIKNEEDPKNSEGGILDILIQINDKVIIIENKIDTETHDYQLCRYYNWGAKLKEEDLISEFKLVYLTIDGSISNLDNEAWGEENKDKYICMSYKNVRDILDKKVEKGQKDCNLIDATMCQYKDIITQLFSIDSNDSEYQNEYTPKNVNDIWEDKIMNRLSKDYGIEAEILTKKEVSGKKLEIKPKGWNGYSIYLEKWATPFTDTRSYDVFGIHTSKGEKTKDKPLLESLQKINFNCNAGWALERSIWYPFGFIEDRTCTLLSSTFIQEENKNLIDSIVQGVNAMVKEVEERRDLKDIIIGPDK